MEFLSINKSVFDVGAKIENFLSENFYKPPILLCIGTDKILADSLGSLIATTLRNADYPNFIYGGLSAPITHQNAQFCHDFIHKKHQNSPLIIIDSMVSTHQNRLGQIVLTNNYTGAINSLKLTADLFIFGITGLVQNNKIRSASLCNIFDLNLIICGAMNRFIKNTQKIKKNIINKI